VHLVELCDSVYVGKHADASGTRTPDRVMASPALLP
jgi:hypothetical protein